MCGVHSKFITLLLGGALVIACGCSRQNEDESSVRHELSDPIRQAVRSICKLELTSGEEHRAKLLNVRGMTARQFKAELEAIEGQKVHVWMPGEKDWLLVGVSESNQVSLARAMEVFAADTNETSSVAEVFASYVGTREDVLPAFESRLVGEVVPEWFVTKEVPTIDWLNCAGIDADILHSTLREIRSLQVVRREILRGNVLAAQAKDKKGEEAAIEVWARAALRNPNDPLLLERIENLSRNARGFLEVGKVLPAMKCYETIILIQPKNAMAVNNFGLCLKKIGKLDMAEQVLKRARQLQEL